MRLYPSLLLIALASSSTQANEPARQTARSEYFEKKIRPIFVERCYSCHSNEAKTIHGGLRLDSTDDLLPIGDSGQIVVPGKPDESLLIEAVRYEDNDIQMPPDNKLSDREIVDLVEWVKQGAYFPSADTLPARSSGIDFAAGRQFWSFLPTKVIRTPVVKNGSWPRTKIDYFVLAKLEQNALQPSPEADRRTLLRRLSFDLTGLPPTSEDVQRFVNDNTPDAYVRQVDRLLNSPHFGERWARMWLDLARYTDKTASWLHSTGQAHLYRDWVVNAMNSDMPYPEFVRRQLATDLDPKTGPNDLPALGFLGLSPNYWKELMLPAEVIKVIVADEWEERVDAVSRSFLGLTVACARCHDHKFDPISSQDYYALAGVFASCRLTERPLIDVELFEPARLAREKVADLEKQIAELKKKEPSPTESIEKLSTQIDQLKATPHYDVPMANAVSEESLYVVRAGEKPEEGTKLDYRAEPRDLNLFIRGNPNRLGEVVPRRFLQVFTEGQPQPFKNGSGRLELAEAITTQAAHLTARVIVNRIWLAHFGRGLVTTPSNFGQTGDRPSHPELLDDLTARFMDGGWSLKQLHREVVLSSTYRQVSSDHEFGTKLDAENRLLWRMNRRRLDVESWRDAMLLVTQQLDRQLGGISSELEAKVNRRRTLYATIHRREMSDVLLSHDFPDPASHSPKRINTTTALQGLYALNGPLLTYQAKTLARRIASNEFVDDADRIRQVYDALFARRPTEREMALGLEFLAHKQSWQEAWEQYAHVLLASNEFLFVY